MIKHEIIAKKPFMGSRNWDNKMNRLLIKKVNKFNIFKQKTGQDMLILHNTLPTLIQDQVLQVEIWKNKENTDHD